MTLHSVPKPRMVAKPPKKYVKRVNPKRAAIRRARDYGKIADWLVTLPCCVCGRRTGDGAWSEHAWSYVRLVVVAAHVRSRGSGGRKQANLIPLAQHLHERQHAMGWESIGLTKEKAKHLATEYEALYRSLFATSDETGDDTK